MERALASGLEAVAVPLFRLEPVTWTVPPASNFDGLLVTSANAVRLAGAGLAALWSLLAYAVGEATAAALRDRGFAVAATGNGGIDRLLASVDPGLRLLHLCGEERREPVGAQQEITPLTVYRVVPMERPTGMERLTGAIALVHSPKAGERLAELVSDRTSTIVAAISPAAAGACGLGWRHVEAASQPTDGALLSLAERLCQEAAGR